MRARDLIDRIRDEAGRGRVVVGVAGAPGVGKSHTAGLLVEALGAADVPAALVPMDGFHLGNRQLDRLGLRARKGAPETFDVDGYVRLLALLRDRPDRPVYVPAFDRALDEPVAAGLVVGPADAVVVTEGNYLLHPDGAWGAVAGLLDLTIHLDAPADVRRARLVDRHRAGGRSAAEAAAYAEEVDGANALLVEACRDRADLILDAASLAAGLAQHGGSRDR